MSTAGNELSSVDLFLRGVSLTKSVNKDARWKANLESADDNNF